MLKFGSFSPQSAPDYSAHVHVLFWTWNFATFILSAPLSSSFSSFYPKPNNGRTWSGHQSQVAPFPSASSKITEFEDVPPLIESTSDLVENCKRNLIQMCESHELGSSYSSIIDEKIIELEQLGEVSGYGQASSLSGLISGTWELIYASDDVTRSSPFFWAFRRAFPDSSDQVFGITDAIPEPLKLVGPAIQMIDVDSNARPISGTLVSRVKVSGLGGASTSMMTTRCTVLGAAGMDGLRLRVDTTKPEDSMMLNKLGPLGDLLSSAVPPFPSGDVLERIAPGSSEVVVRTTYCDEGLRVTRNDDRNGDVFVWKRANFGIGNSAAI